MKGKSLIHFILLSISTSCVIIFLKSAAYLTTGSVALLSDALESVAILVSAIIAFFMLKLAEKPPDNNHLYGYTKAEYFSSIIEGTVILITSLSITIAAVDRLLYPKPIEQAYIGLIICLIATLINSGVAQILLAKGKQYRSITLEADGHHLMTDVWTSVGIIGGVFLVALTNIQILDPVIALLVACYIIVTGLKIIKQSALGLLDASLPSSDIEKIKSILQTYCTNGVSYHGFRSRESASRQFMSVHILVPGKWTVQKGHNLLEKIEYDIYTSFPKMTVLTHLEPKEDPKSINDISIDRTFNEM